MSNQNKDYFFLISLRKPSKENAADNVKFLSPKNNFPDCIYNKEENGNLIKVFKCSGTIKDEILSFLFDDNEYKLKIEHPKENTFFFDITLQKKEKNIFSKIPQNKLGYPEKTNFFYDALIAHKETNKIDILYKDSINMFSKFPKFHSLINIFVRIYNSKLCAKLLEEFSKKIDEKKIKDIADNPKLEQYKYNFDQICEDMEKIISTNSLDKINFYGLVLCYLNNYRNEKYQNVIKELYNKDKKVFFEVMLRFKSYLKKPIDISDEQFNEIIIFAAEKDFLFFKNKGLLYINNDIIKFLKIIEKNKEKIIKLKDFSTIEITKIEERLVIDFNELLSSIIKINNFSGKNSILLVYFMSDFWESLEKKFTSITKENIEYCKRIRNVFLAYYTILKKILDKDKNNVILTEMTVFQKKQVASFAYLSNKLVTDYLKNNQISNIEILNLIKGYNLLYSQTDNENIIKKRDPEILSKIDLEEVDSDFIKAFKDMDFEELYKNFIAKYFLVFTKKIKKIFDINIVIKLINEKKLGDQKQLYIEQLKFKYNDSIKSSELSENDEDLIKSLANLTSFICENENNLSFLEKNIKKSKEIKHEIKHKTYIELLKLSYENNNENIKEYIKNLYYPGSLESQKLEEFIDFLKNLKENEMKDLIKNIDKKYYIIKDDFYSSDKNLNIQLFYLIKKDLTLKEESKYIKNNNEILQKIFEEIDDKKLKYEQLKNFYKKQEVLLDKLKVLPSNNPEEILKNILAYYSEMEKKINELSNYKSSLEKYHQNSKKKLISNINKKIEEIMKIDTYGGFEGNLAEIENIIAESKETVVKVEEVDSNLFKIFYDEINNNKNKEKNIDVFSLACKELEIFKQLFNEKGDNIFEDHSKQSDILKIIIKKIKDIKATDKSVKNDLDSFINNAEKNKEETKLFLHRENFEKDLKSMIYFLSNFKNINNEWIDLNEKFQNYFSKKTSPPIKEFLIELQKEEIYDYTQEIKTDMKSNYIKFFNLFYEKNQAIDFLMKYTAEDIKQLYDKIEPSVGTLKMSDIKDTIDCILFFKELKEIKGGLKELINHIKKLNNKEEPLLNQFMNYTNIYRAVIDLNQNFDYSLSTYNETKALAYNAIFYFNKDSDEFKYKENDKEKYNKIDIEKIREYKNKIQIRQIENMDIIYNEYLKKYKEKYEIYNFFKEASNNIEEIYYLMSIIRAKGSTIPISIGVELAYPDMKFYSGKEKKDKDEILKFLSKAKTNIINKLDSVYKQMETIRFIYGKQINSFLSYIQGNIKIDSFLRYILNYTGFEKVKEGEKNFSREVSANNIDDYNTESFNFIHDYIISLFKKNNNSSIKEHYQNISIKKDNEKENELRGIYKYLSQSSSMEEDILQIFLDKVGKIPVAQNILIHTEETSDEEMQAFFNRAILCKYNSLFVVEVNGSFSNNQQRIMNIFIDKLLTHKNMIFNNKDNEEKFVDKSETSLYMDSCLVFIYNKQTSSFLNEIKYYDPPDINIKNEHELRKTNSSQSSKNDYLREQLLANTHIKQSEICGLGKSTMIRNEIKKSGKQYHYFPLGGNLTREKIYQKLDKLMKKIKSNSKEEKNFSDIAIHLDLYETRQESVLNEFLFSFLITKFYSNNENIIFIPTNIEIYVEIPNSFRGFINKYGILKFFKRDEDMIQIDNLPELALPEKTVNLLKKMLNLKDNKAFNKWIKGKFEMLGKEIFKEKGKVKYSYHQIHIFIKLFICQYNMFKGQKITFWNGNINTTKECIDSFSKATKYFIYGEFSQLLLAKTYKVETEEQEKDLLSQEYFGHNDLEKEEFKDEIIFIVKKENKDERFKGVYYRLNISKEALEKGEGLWELTEDEKKKRKAREKKLGAEKVEKLEYLNILKTILDLKTPVEPLDPNNNNEISLLKIIEENNYIMTVDNFRKMILILYRIIANIPVILMGETGCGKTKLIEVLNKLLNNGKNTFYKINIDPSYNDEKLINEMNKINDLANKNKKDNLWVFFDELNTTDSLSLITEIFLNRTFGENEKLADNIRLIGACNPFRKKIKDKTICGLTYHNENDTGLVYLVNNLPQSLMYYVFNFGRLDKINEDKYISSIISDTIKDKKLKEATKNVISKCHEFLRNNFDDSVVSLREIVRFNALYKFFIDYFYKKNIIKEIPVKEKENEPSKLKSIIISIYLNYYIRLVDGGKRNEFEAELKGPFKELVNYKYKYNNHSTNFNEKEVIYDGDLKKDLQDDLYRIKDFENFNFSQILSAEEDFILDEINLDKGIGRNKSLKENIFLLFISLVTHIPLIIIGKPGSSKSLSAQIINNAMNGKYSNNKLFKLYPSIIQSYFQGSNTTKPEDIEKIFNIANIRLKNLQNGKNSNSLEKIENNNKNKDNNITHNNLNKENSLPISMILFDELGLAERSKYNPLKALHSHLEFDGNKNDVSFVGISNWTLDAAKVNRALNLSVPDLENSEKDLQLTSISIAKSINESYDKNLFEDILPKVYRLFKKYLKTLKKLTVYKQYEIEEYKFLVNKYKEEEKFIEIFKNENIEITDKEIYEYKTFKNKKIRQNLKKFLEKKEKCQLFDGSPFDNAEFINLYDRDKKIKENVIGARDFYYLVRLTANITNKMNNMDKKKVIKNQIERNFGGFEIEKDFEEDYTHLYESQKYNKMTTDFLNKIKEIKEKDKWSSAQIFEMIYNLYCNNDSDNGLLDYILDEGDDFDYMKNIIENIKDVKSRYLLLGIRSSLTSLIHKKIEKEFDKLQKDNQTQEKTEDRIYFHEGSPFINDNNNEYQFNMIKKIQIHAEKGDVVILSNLNQIYPFLYDLFNKNFIIKDGKQYARICLGNISEQLTPVKETFRVIIMVNKNYLDKVEPPFLNRFEKVLISFSQLINEKQKQLANEISREINMKELIKIKYNKINYRLDDLLIGCSEEDIRGMVYYESDFDMGGKKEITIEQINEIKNKIFNKIFKLLPQDIIVNLENKNDKDDKDDLNLKDLCLKMKRYYNLEQYIKDKPEHKITIIYTFNNIKNRIEYIDEPSTIIISEIKSEGELSNKINNIISEKFSIKNKNDNRNINKNIIFIQFDEINSKKIQFLITFVNNNYKNNNEIKFIFLVHIKRNFFINQQKEKKEKIFTVLDIDPDIYQIFIDNLIGENINLKEILNNSIIKILIEKGNLKLENEFKNSLKEFINKNLINLKGDNDTINIANYLKKLKEFFDEKESLKNHIIDKIQLYFNEDHDILSNIFEKIYKNNYINKNSIDLISVIKEFVLKEVIYKYINIILGKLEDNNILTSLLVLNNDKELINDELKENIIEIIREYITDIELEEEELKPKFDLRFIIPCFYDYYSKLSDYINQNIKSKFFKNEKRMRNPPSEKKISRNDLQEDYNKNEDNFLYLSSEEIQKYKYFRKFFNIINNSELILNDYITYYLIKYDSDGDIKNILNNINLAYNDDKHKLIVLLLNERYNEKKRIVKIIDNDPLKLLLLKINWMEANSEYIKRILKIYDILKNLFDEKEYIKIIEESFKKEPLRYITSEKRNPEISTEVNECFYKILATFCYSIIPPNINFEEKIETYNYIDDLKKAMVIIKGLNSELITCSIEVDLLEEIIKVYDILEINQKLNNTKGLTDICIRLKKITSILAKNEDIQSEQLIELFQYLIDAINNELKYNDKKYFDLLKFIYFKETKKAYNVSYRTAIFQEMIKDTEILIKSNDTLQILLLPIVKPNKDDFPKSIKNILSAVDYDIALTMEDIFVNGNEDMKIALEDALLYYFEKNSLMYFDNIFNGENKIFLDLEDYNKENKKIKGPLKLFEDCINCLIDYKNNKNFKEKNKNICKLFCLGYIKAYCYTFINLSELSSPYLNEKSNIIEKVNNAGILAKNISFYIGKIIYNKNKKNIDLFIDPDYRKEYQIDNYFCFKGLGQNKNPFTYNYIRQNNKDIYDKFNQILEKYKYNGFETVKVRELNLMIKYDIDIFFFSTSIIILSQLKQKQSIESPIYGNFYNNICVPLFKNNIKTFNAIKLLYDPQRFKIIETQLCKGKITEKEKNIIPENLNIILQSYRYFINEISSNSRNSIFGVFYERYIETIKINDYYYPGNDIKDKPIYSIYSKIIQHFKNNPSEGCFVCLCKEGGFYHNIKGGIPKEKKYLDLKCTNCKEKIGAIINERGFLTPVKRNKYFRIFKTEEEADNDRNKNSDKYNCMSLEEFKEKHIYDEYIEEKGIPKNDEYFFRKDDKIIRNLSQISYRILNFILYSHIIFSKLYNNNTTVLDIYLPKDLSLIQILIDCWKMIKKELIKVGIHSIEIFMNYIFPELFSFLNNQERIKEFKKYSEIEKALDDKILNKILEFKEDYKRFIHSRNTGGQISFQDLIEERY